MILQWKYRAIYTEPIFRQGAHDVPKKRAKETPLMVVPTMHKIKCYKIASPTQAQILPARPVTNPISSTSSAAAAQPQCAGITSAAQISATVQQAILQQQQLLLVVLSGALPHNRKPTTQTRDHGALKAHPAFRLGKLLRNHSLQWVQYQYEQHWKRLPWSRI